ncbi:signal peptidase I [Bdellovibrio sp. SKB1291214]|uniref:signal peptidase I n=1 Tax=Bdellovibrio sp. SKB1291214 TaxID=1732569 RepID=UPI000B517F46|nr:signal peptidase I [Bdellovibrio sp. SKB1291214]UYL08977.1 signal peptidase I [Bdellovibrio sp. SKB1291214]
MNSKQPVEKNLKGTWNQAILTFLFPILLVMGVRWALFEPFVIPSGSMIPNLLVHDHILVKKFAYGLHLPFRDKWMFQWSSPERGQIIVFKYPENPDVYYIKRLIGLPGDEVSVKAGRISINGSEIPLVQFDDDKNEKGFSYFEETMDKNTHAIRFMDYKFDEDVSPQVFKVPEGHFFFMGDNRDQSSDSRVWGFVKKDYIVGRAWAIWLSCENTLPTMTFMCDPAQMRWSRLFKTLH